MIQTKYFVLNPENNDLVLAEMSVVIPANGKVEICRDFAIILSKQFEVRKITIEWGSEIDNVNYAEFLENSREAKLQDKSSDEKTPIEEVVEAKEITKPAKVVKPAKK